MALRKFLRKPKLEDGSLQSVFFYCDMSVNHHMQALNHLMRTNPDNLDRRATLIKQLKDAQHNLMNVIMSIADQAIPDNRASRDFRVKYPDDVVLDQINGPIWFGAECIAAGSHIANHELESTELRPFAIHLSKVVTKLRQVLRVHSISGKEGYSQKIKDMLIAFDELWADFEFRYIGLMCNVKSELQYYHQQDVVVLFCESTLRAIRKKYLSYESIEMMDPSAMFAIPRLAILCGLTVFPDGPIDPSSRPSKDMPQCFRAYRQLLLRIKDLLSHLNSDQLDVLEQALCSAEGLGKLERNKLKAAKRKNKARQDKAESEASPMTSRSSSEQENRTQTLVSAEAASEPPRSPASLRSISEDMGETTQEPVRRLVFEPSPVRVASEAAAMAERDVEAEVLITEPFPQFGTNRPVDNELPSSTPSHGEQHLPNATENKLEQQQTTTANTLSYSSSSPSSSPKTSSKRKGIAGFPSAEDLMHRLFLGISGVADQLQTNHAKDLRVILKTVFTVCQSDPMISEDTIQGVELNACPLTEPCIAEPRSPLITRSSRFSFEVSGVERCPSWVSDADSPTCSMCSERFSWKRRRHHCRRCGNVVCAKCSPNSIPLFQFGVKKPVRVCSDCYISELGRILNVVTGNPGMTASLQV